MKEHFLKCCIVISYESSHNIDAYHFAGWLTKYFFSAVVFSSGRFSGFSNESIVEKAVQDFFDDIVVVTPNGQTPAITYGM